MFFNTPNYEPNSVVLFCMVSGQFIIGRIKQNANNQPVLHKPRTLVMQQSQAGISVGFAPIGAPFFSDADVETISIPAPGNCLASKLADKQMSDMYIREVSGIMPVRPGIGDFGGQSLK